MWQKINHLWLFCHWWQDSNRRRITAMTILLIALTALLVTATTVVLARTILSDGYGTRPAPRSHFAYFAGHTPQ